MKNNDNLFIDSRIKCENCGYIYVAPYPGDFLCIKCNCFLTNLYDSIKEKSDFFREVYRDFEIRLSRNIEGTERRENSTIPKKIHFYGIVSKDRIPIYYSNKEYKYLL